MTEARRRVWRIAPLELPAAGFDRLEEEARAEGHRFLDRMRHEWSSGTNRFDRPGERLLAAYDGETLVAIGGLNIDPYARDPSVGRLRHIYVLNGWRRQGLVSCLRIAFPFAGEVARQFGDKRTLEESVV